MAQKSLMLMFPLLVCLVFSSFIFWWFWERSLRRTISVQMFSFYRMNLDINFKNFFIEPPIVTPVGETVIRTNISTNITLRCVATGYPKPVVKWTTPSKSNGIARASKGELLLRHITKNHQGQYKCQASNLGGFAEETFTVLINGRYLLNY